MTPAQCLIVIAVGLIGALTCGWQAGHAIRAMRHDDYRTRNDRAAAHRITRLEDRPEPGTPGHDAQLLNQCRAICPELAPKEDQ